MDERVVWEYLIDKLGNAYGVAGLMGNLYAESKLNPKNLQSTYASKLGFTNDSYTQAVDARTYTNFVYDSAGYGIAQWTYWSRKKGLYDLARQSNISIGDLSLQLKYLWSELQQYPQVCAALKSATSIAEASDIVLTKYEQAANQSAAAKQMRRDYAQKFYDQFTRGSDNMAIDYNKYIFSTGTHYISNSGKDENGNYTNGVAGDQTGHEWELKAWYNRPWTVVLRYPDQNVALKIAELSIAAALNNKIGYDQYQRTTYWTQLSKVGYDPSKITVACEEDCTAGVSANVRAAGYLCGIKALQNVPICSSRNMRSEFVAAGFKALTDSKYLTSAKYLLPGDILLYVNHHAAANVTIGSAVKNDWHPSTTSSDDIEAPIPEVTIELPSIKIVGGSVNVRKGPGTEYGTLGVAKTNDYLFYFGYQYSNGWYLVKYDGQTGWVSNKYGEIVG